LLTVISIVPTATAASTGIDFVSPAACYFYNFPYIKCKTYKTSSNSRQVGEVENFINRPVVTALGTSPLCEKSVLNLAETLQQDFHFSGFAWALHRFHIAFTDLEKEDCAAQWKT
jgi:hypothetical protein